MIYPFIDSNKSGHDDPVTDRQTDGRTLWVGQCWLTFDMRSGRRTVADVVHLPDAMLARDLPGLLGRQTANQREMFILLVAVEARRDRQLVVPRVRAPDRCQHKPTTQ